jgi:hypothetical protein
MIRIRGGIEFLINEITRFEKAVTTITESPITMAGFSLTVTASAEQIPKICTVTGFSRLKGFDNNFEFLFDDIVFRFY